MGSAWKHIVFPLILGLWVGFIGLASALGWAGMTGPASNASAAAPTPGGTSTSPRISIIASPTATPIPITSGGGGSDAFFLPLIENQVPNSPPVPIIQGNGDPVINAVGDIAACSLQYSQRDGYLQTAALLQQLDGPILGLGDYVYPDGTPTYFTNCFDPVWGPFKSRIYPVAGNHEYQYPGAAGYFNYFGPAAGSPSGYYSFDLGAWHVVALNANCSQAGAPLGCAAGSPQEAWLRADLAAHATRCTLAFWHQPLYSSGKEGNFPEVHDLYQALVDNHVDLILNGHDHSYERFAPQDANGLYDPVNGIPEIIAGTGGKDHSPLVSRQPNSLVFDNTSFGVLRVALHPTGYAFQFIPVAGSAFTDSGSGICH